jgi:hypothetical protein
LIWAPGRRHKAALPSRLLDPERDRRLHAERAARGDDAASRQAFAFADAHRIESPHNYLMHDEFVSSLMG